MCDFVNRIDYTHPRNVSWTARDVVRLRGKTVMLLVFYFHFHDAASFFFFCSLDTVRCQYFLVACSKEFSNLYTHCHVQHNYI